MQTVNHKKNTRSVVTLTPILSLLLLAFFSNAAQALMLRIDSARSEIRSITASPFCLFNAASGELDCPDPIQPQTFTVAGSVDVRVIHQYLDFGPGYPIVDRDLLSLRMTDLVTDALEQGFFPIVDFALLTGETFEARSNPCFLFVGPGSCSGWVLGNLGDSQGTWDGNTLTWSGYMDPSFNFLRVNPFASGDAFNYTIVATAVTEPATLPLMLLLLPLLFIRRLPTRCHPLVAVSG